MHFKNPDIHVNSRNEIQFEKALKRLRKDFNNEIILGDAREESLHDIWNGGKYQQFRKDHFSLTRGIKCTEQCDMKLIGSYFS